MSGMSYRAPTPEMLAAAKRVAAEAPPLGPHQRHVLRTILRPALLQVAEKRAAK